MLKKNYRYFEISQDNPESHLDENYFVIEKFPELDRYVSGVKEIKEILITIKKIRETGEKEEFQEKYFKKLFDVFNNNFSNCSELGCFVNACDTTRDLIQKDFNSFKKVTLLFLKHRELNDRVPENWIQAIIDSNSSRKKGELGERKLISILKKYKYKEVNDWERLYKENKCVARFSKDIFSTKSIRKNLNLKIAAKKQDKRLDLLIKNNNKIFLLEAKHSNVGGGGQDKQISELIEILSLKEEWKNISYVAFLDGTYSNVLLGEVGNRAEKRSKQRSDIEKYLKKNKQNFWVNTAGFQNLIKDLG